VTRVAAIGLLVAVLLALTGAAAGSNVLWASGAIGIITCSMVLIVAPAVTLLAVTLRPDPSISRGLGRAAQVSGMATIVLGLVSWMIRGIPYDDQHDMRPFLTVLAIAAIAIGVLALMRARGTRERWGEGRPAEAYLVPAGIGIGIVGLLSVQPYHGERKSRSDAYAVRYVLRNLITVEAGIFADSGHYTTVPAESLLAAPTGVVEPVITLTGDGWIARAGHSRTSIECAVYVGSTPARPATRPKEPACTQTQDQRDEMGERVAYLALGLALAVVGVRIAGRRA
jgi:hypothetical protein